MSLPERILLFALGIIFMPGSSFNTNAISAERAAAVAGSFYPSDKTELKSLVDSFLQISPVITAEVPRLFISPHAGYIFSGPVAARGFAHLDNSVKRVILLGPSHYQAFSGFAYPEVTSFVTPLGKVPLDSEIINKLKKHPKARPTAGIDAKEHCLEVQLPFLQVKLEQFTIVPLLLGRIQPEDAASILFPYIDESTIIIASSDLSHYHSQKDARRIDDHSIKAILEDKPDEDIDACGNLPIRTVMALSRNLHLKPLLLDSRTSFQTAPNHCSDNRVVGYGSIVYVKELPDNKHASDNEHDKNDFNKESRGLLLKIARNSLLAAVNDQPLPHSGELSDLYSDHRGCFVTLTKNKQLRGCIGYIEPVKPLYQAIIENACNAALYDHRFTPVRKDEVDAISIEISILTRPVPLAFKTPDELLRLLRPGIDGVILTNGSHQSTFLPQVWEQLPDKIQFLEHLSIKGSMPKDGWKTSTVKVYSVEHFAEEH